jgi:hypothetical protein
MKSLSLLVLALVACGGSSGGPPAQNVPGAARWLVDHTRATFGEPRFVELRVTGSRSSVISAEIIDAKGVRRAVSVSAVDKALISTVRDQADALPGVSIGAAELAGLDRAVDACQLKVGGRLHAIEMFHREAAQPASWRITTLTREDSGTAAGCMATLTGELISANQGSKPLPIR